MIFNCIKNTWDANLECKKRAKKVFVADVLYWQNEKCNKLSSDLSKQDCLSASFQFAFAAYQGNKCE